MSREKKEILCLFDVDGTVTPPRQVRWEISFCVPEIYWLEMKICIMCYLTFKYVRFIGITVVYFVLEKFKFDFHCYH